MIKHLTQTERYYIWKRIANFDSISQIARDLKVNKSTISRELKRNKNASGFYLPGEANVIAAGRRYVSGKKKQFSKFKPKILKYILEKLNQSWSPEQISGRMKKDLKKSISHETIYQYIYQDKLKGGSLFKLLPHQGKKYKYRSVKHTSIPNRVDISLRPKIVEDKARIGDWEADTIVGNRGGEKDCLLTLVDRKSKFALVKKIKDRSAISVQKAIEAIYDLTTIPFKTITPDNGTEFANHQNIAANIGCDFYFARPYKSCDRGLNEHTNGLIRRFLPKKTDFSKVSNDTITYIQELLNHRPRKVLNYLTPYEVMLKYLKRIYPKMDNVAFHI